MINRDGRVMPLWFRLEMENHAVWKCRIKQIMSRDAKKYVDVREKRFVYKTSMGEKFLDFSR